MGDFVDWLKDELNKRGWSNNELGRRLGKSSSAISLVFTGQRKPTWRFCMQLAQVLDKPPVYVLRIAQLLPPVSDEQLMAESQTSTEAEQKMLEAFRGLQAQDREAIARIIYALARGQEEAQKDNSE